MNSSVVSHSTSLVYSIPVTSMFRRLCNSSSLDLSRAGEIVSSKYLIYGQGRGVPKALDLGRFMTASISRPENGDPICVPLPCSHVFSPKSGYVPHHNFARSVSAFIDIIFPTRRLGSFSIRYWILPVMPFLGCL